MKTTSFCALCAAFAVPALVQPAMAEESPAEMFVTALAEGQAAIADIYTALDEEKMTPDEAASLMNELIDALEELIYCERDEKTQEEIEELLEENNEGFLLIEEGVDILLESMKEANYLDSPNLKAACERYIKLWETDED